jgi:rare lipoprotein A
MRRIAAGLLFVFVCLAPHATLADVPYGHGLAAQRREVTVRVNGCPVIQVLTPDGFPSVARRAQVIEGRLLRLAAQAPLNPAYLVVRTVGRLAVVAYGGQIVATADPSSARRLGLGPLALACRWADNLALALGVPTYPEDLVAKDASFTGAASWYGPGFVDSRTADGEVFDPHLYTAANRWLPFNTLLAVTDLRTGRSVLVRVNDRGPFVAGRILDLSQAAAHAIGLSGVDDVRCTVVWEPELRT